MVQSTHFVNDNFFVDLECEAFVARAPLERA